MVLGVILLNGNADYREFHPILWRICMVRDANSSLGAGY